MATKAQSAANRRNAKKSTGPRTPAGRSTSSQNSRRHGLYSTATVLSYEDRAEFDQIRQAFFAEHQPQTPTETFFVQSLVDVLWRLKRLDSLEEGYFHLHDDDLRDAMKDAYHSIWGTYRMAYIALHSGDSSFFAELGRHYARLQKLFQRTLKQLTGCKAARPAAAQDSAPTDAPAPPKVAPSPSPVSTSAKLASFPRIRESAPPASNPAAANDADPAPSPPPV